MSRKSKSSRAKTAASGSRDRRRRVDEETPGPPENRSPEAARAEEIRTGAQRETVEAFVVAFILALLFRAFIAEAFVIPTGSMAPTLMGAHKDLTCDRCGQPFAVGASLERRDPATEAVVVAGTCPNCRHTNILDLAGESNHTTFSGDRILVSKFAYTMSEPERWDVIVFKFPGNPKQNYIKRLVGLPNETLTIRHGDVYRRPRGAGDGDGGDRDEILRKSPSKLLAMRHLVHDTSHQSPALIEADYPPRWQPWEPGAEQPPDNSWVIERSSAGLTARLSSADPASLKWLRYFHRWPDDDEWARADAGLSLAGVDPYQSRLITDFYAYDSAVTVDADEVYARKPSQYNSSRLNRIFGSGYGGGVFDRSYRSGGSLAQFPSHRLGVNATARDGLHWVGDLILEADVETSADAAELVLELVEAGVVHRCRFDLTDGTAVLSLADGEGYAFDDDAGNAPLTRTAVTNLRAGDRHRIRFSNCDNELLVWLDGSVVSFDGPTTFDARAFRPAAENYPRYNGAEHPLDASPLAIAVRGGSATIHCLRIDRDKYYIATRDSNYGVDDYDMRELSRLLGGASVSLADLQAIMSDPALWSRFPGWGAREEIRYTLEEGQYFPMGDNSPESLDARCWAGTKFSRYGVDEDAYRWSDASYVPRDLLVGKALVIFWPHPWNSPIPFMPNFRRMQLIH